MRTRKLLVCVKGHVICQCKRHLMVVGTAYGLRAPCTTCQIRWTRITATENDTEELWTAESL